MADLDDEDEFPNYFDGLDFDCVPALQPPTLSSDIPQPPVPHSTVPRNTTPSTTASPVPSSGSDSVEDMDTTFLAAVDALEARALSEMRGGDHPTDTEKALSSERVDERSHPRNMLKPVLDSPQGEFFSVNRKGKRKAELQEDIDVRAILAGYEAELICPICCDLLVGAQVANPCGHTCCGECGYGWLAQNKYEPTCAVCRSDLFTRKPLLPNFVVDSLVRQHLQALARSGLPEWQERGYRTIEWNKRAESWKKETSARAAKEKLKETARSRRHRVRYYEIEDPHAPAWLIDQGMESELPLSPRVVPRRGTRTRR